MQKYFFFLLCTSLFQIISAQQIPAYYNSIDFSERDLELKAEISTLINNTHTYYTSYGELWDILQEVDLVNSNSDDVTLAYGWDDANQEDDDDLTRYKYYTCGNGNPCTDITWNREHVFPKGLDLSSSNNEGPTADAYHIRACDVEMNGDRGNKKFASGSGLESYTINNNKFYPGEEWKGDVARIIMYMYVHYGEDWNANLVGEGSNTYHEDMPDIFLEWNVQDPPSDQELRRNEILEPIQGNRNPFIDNPFIATLIWGGPVAEDSWDSLNTTITQDLDEVKYSISPNPIENSFKILNADDTTQYRIYTLNGQVIQKGKGNRINLNAPVGAYLIEYIINGKVHSNKILKK